ncbi:hypothetical protein K2173_004417 [Erythroxylum novogranatense]|uniref:Receptor-like serine/threonine-protein kinase n=1 Tax=Erythroxylum novogranatense TaxID=1862640 RepID=A0AAV8T5J4_9ROSI|nr:hypothetical protein K2173_004417 [Erythroxylum novogranatense]
MDALHGSLSTFLLLLTLRFSISMDTITPDNSIKDGNVLVSNGGNFALGFFCPDTARSTPRYLGIWYHKVSELTVVWVANRDKPLNDSSGVLTINNRGSLVIYATNQSFPLWSSDISALPPNNSMAQLLDTGNLVLLQQDSKRVLWQSFDYPTDTLLPNMKLGLDKRTGLDRFLSSWKSNDDPGTGDIYYRIDPTGYPQLILYKGSQKWWRGGPWTGQRWSGVPEMTKNYIFNVSFENNKDEVSIMYGVINSAIISKMSINESGFVQRSTWNGHDRRWIGIWSAPKDQCDNYNECGPNSNCDPYNPDAFICKCLPSYEPKSPRDWYLRDGSGGCIRKANVSVCRSGEGFIKVAPVRVPDTSVALADMNLNLKACKQECLKNCSCTAYTSADERGFGCLMWYGDLVDTRTYSNIGQDIYIRVDAEEFAKYQKSRSTLAKPGMKAMLITSIAVAFFLMVVAVFWWISWRKKVRERQNKFDFRFTSSYLGDSPSEMELNESRRPSDLPLFDLSTIAEATNNFSLTNKLGEGGFGSVYKGILTDGREIAIKRLSKNSGQGIEEFKTEVAVIAKLQHRNLVRIVGCCIHDKEKMLIYEYLPNKSLDSFIFDKTRGSLLNWTTRFNIVCGIARGMLYLHQDSRLRIIHRDLKASNVLLDASMNPKISDFGMARIVGVDQIQTNTKRIVGTYGYMSPEYAMQGLFSVKSDVYSFGVLLLEIISGRKNNSYYHESSDSNMVGYVSDSGFGLDTTINFFYAQCQCYDEQLLFQVWDQWKEGSAMEVVDLSLTEPYPEHEVLRCIHIGLLCVQDSAVDRPTMSTVVFLLSNDTILPPPKQPAFIFTKTSNSGDPSTSEGAHSLNDVTVTSVQAR